MGFVKRRNWICLLLVVLVLTIMMLTKDSLTILTSAKKAAAFEKDCREVFGDNVPGGKLDLTVLVKDKTDSYASNYAALMAKAAMTNPITVNVITCVCSSGMLPPSSDQDMLDLL